MERKKWHPKIKKIHLEIKRKGRFLKKKMMKIIEDVGIEIINIVIFFQAVKRSRVKSKLRTQQTLERVNQLKTENELLEEKIKMLTKELGFLKDLFLAHAGSSQHSVNFQDVDLNALLAEDTKPVEQMKETPKP
ncbi:hypothetical protein K0M31_015971 [Melipona bicolor]|uniref:BZIP domain-containing protein n=1 Tax=Melipona bicolor TaxID=60889 RepID=A0AA40G661_9HYME|nr:hypothetical protein K0M31_015971 [Melipona bicolor]